MLSSLVLACVQLQPLAAPALAELHQRRRSGAEALDAALAAAVPLDDGSAVVALEQAALVAAASDLGDAVTAHLRAATAFAPFFGSAADVRAYLVRSLGAAREALAFAPVSEAPLPVDYPAFTPVGEIALLEYPAVRLARAPMGRGSNTAFWSLFQHIQSSNIAMTAPVQTDYADAAGSGEASPATMGFLYDVPERGPAGSFGPVEVFDQPGLTVLSVGQSGWTSPTEIERLAQFLADHLAAHGDGWKASGPLRVLEYNGPSVRGPRRFFEVQLPVCRVEATPLAKE